MYSKLFNGYVPNRTSLPMGDSIRQPIPQGNVIGQNINAASSLYTKTTGYTPQRYSSQNTITPQTLMIPTVNNQVNKLTAANDSLSNRNIKGLTTTKLK